MKQTSVLVLLFSGIVGLMLVGATNTDQPLNTILAEINQSSFGQAVQAMVQMSAPSGRLNELNELLVSIQATIDQQQKDADTKIESDRAYCSSQQTEFETQVSSTTTIIQDDEEEIAVLTQEQTDKNSELQSVTSSLAQTRIDLEQAKADIESEKTQFEEHKSSFNEAIVACEEAIRLLTELATGHATSFAQLGSHGVMFVQLSQKFENVKNLLESHVKKTHNAFIQPIIDVLLEMGQSSHLDLERVKQIINLIQTLLDRLREGLVSRSSAHELTLSDLTTLIEHLSSTIKTSNTTIEILTTRLSEIQTLLTQKTNALETSREFLVIIKGSLQTLRDTCRTYEDNYNTASASRRSQLLTLEKLIEYFRSQVATTTQAVRDDSYQDSLTN